MARRSPARFLAPLALVGFAVALVVVVGASSSSGGGGVDAPAPVATRTPAGGGEATKPAESAKSAERTSTKSYTIKPGDTPSGIAAAHGISTERLMELNPGLAPESLTVGEKVRVE